MAAILQAYSSSPSRISVALDSTPSTSTADYTLARTNGAATGITVGTVWNRGSNVAELALSGPLLDGAEYTLSVSGAGSIDLVYRDPVVPTIDTGEIIDPEAEAFGVDLGWLGPALRADGNVPRRRGRDCLLYDLKAIAQTVQGELVHRSKAGGNLPKRVNGPSVPTRLSKIRADLTRVWLADDNDGTKRVDRVKVTTTASSSGELRVDGEIRSVALDEPLQLRIQ